MAKVRKANKERKFNFWQGASLLTITLCAYISSFFAGFVYQDILLIIQNPSIRRLSYIPKLFGEDILVNYITPSLAYRPFQIMSYSIDWFLWGDMPFGYHLTNVLLHLVAVFLVWQLLKVLIPKYRWLPWISALLYALHPVHTEVVTYISGRSFSLLTIFTLLSILAWHKAKTLKKRLFHLVALAAFVLALFSHELALIIPLSWLLLDLYENWTSKGKKEISYKSYLPVILVAVIYIVLRFTTLNFGPLEADYGFLPRFLTFMGLIWEYLGLSFTPLWLAVEHPVTQVASILSFWQWVSFIIWIGLISFSLRFLGKRPHITFGVLWMTLWLLPHAGWLPINPALKESYLYLPLIGGVLAFTGLFEIIIEKIATKKRKQIIIPLIVIILLAFSLAIHNRNTSFANEEDFYLHNLSINPESTELQAALAKVYIKKLDWKNAETNLKEALKRDPDHIPSLLSLSYIYLENFLESDALELLEKANELHPDHPIIMLNLGKAQTRTNKYAEAIENLEKALKIEPLNGEINRELALVFGKVLRYDEAEHYFKKAIEIDPRDSKAYMYLGGIFHNERLYQQAVINFSKAVAVDPENNVARLFLEKAQELLEEQMEEIKKKGLKPKSLSPSGLDS